LFVHMVQGGVELVIEVKRALVSLALVFILPVGARLDSFKLFCNE
jgi:hypothetical protein